MTVEYECMYCGKKWEASPRTREEIESAKCSKCGDTGLKVKDVTKTKVDYYQGCPPFPEDKPFNYLDMYDYGSD